MSILFLVTSAIHTKHGIHTADERLAQTIRTLESIRTHAPGARMVLLECSGERSISDDETEILQAHANDIFNFHPDPRVRDIYAASGDNWDIVKNATELVVFCSALQLLLNDHAPLLDGIGRVFKMSGRYVLNENFSLAAHLGPSVDDAYVLGHRWPSHFTTQSTGGLSEQVMSRCWSWPASKTRLVYFRYNLMVEDFMGCHQQGQYRDIEHLLLKYFDGPYLREIPIVGVEGATGPDGLFIRE
ncbi:hypothetical protein [Dyella telluris]|uniref:Uncharacterized protein n=1 Tax=Dyella telluris TaxID=2763498 RepID=A0A7G8Q8W0_9GAMM|nr:hypothetical protein [Dyella telluris]QNK03218.1 hypothetical protein H8F01_08970 [Dyella telluris]